MEDLWKTWNKSQSAVDYDKLFSAARPTIDSAIRSYVGADADPVVRQRASLLAHDAIKTYNPQKGASLKSHIMIQLRPITRFARKITTPVDIPEKRVADIYKLTSAEQELSERLGRDPTDDELADYTGLTKRRLSVIRKSRLMELRPPVGEEGQEMDVAATSVNPEDVWIDYVYHDMDPLNKKIMEWKLGLYGQPQLSNQDIARRLKLTPSAVSQRTNTIIKRLEEFNQLPGDII